MKIEKGMPFLCDNGHYMVMALEDIEADDVNTWGQKIGHWAPGIDPPSIGGDWPKCPVCGADMALRHRLLESAPIELSSSEIQVDQSGLLPDFDLKPGFTAVVRPRT